MGDISEEQSSQFDANAVLDGIGGLSLDDKEPPNEDAVKEVAVAEEDQVKIDNGEGESKGLLVTEEKKIGLYSSNQKILLVGEGDFSFSACLAKAFGSAPNIVATSLDSRYSLEQKYSRASRNLKELEDRGCTVLHGVDAHRMSTHPSLEGKSFDRIIFNFPHAGFWYRWEHDSAQIKLHRQLVEGFLRSASSMLRSDGQVHITHKTAYPFSEWKIVLLAEEVGMRLSCEEKFCIWMFPGYENKRGEGLRCYESFPVGECSTFVFSR